MENIRDWCISRQLWWGHRLPVWFCGTKNLSELQLTMNPSLPKSNGCGEIVVSVNPPNSCPKCQNKNLIQDPDTLDTWFSSGQWPFASLGYGYSDDFKTYYPTDVMETAGEIIFFWVSRMIMLGLYRTGKIPFKTVYLHGLVQDAKGRKMSKSKGNVINPLDLTEKYGTDAFRIGMVIGNTPGTSLALSEDKIRAYKNFANKIWNISRFVLTNTEAIAYDDKFEKFTENDLALIKERDDIIIDVTKDMDNFRFYIAAEKLYHYVWHTFADKILEESKNVISLGQSEEKLSRQQFLLGTLEKILICLHPFMPFVTEEIWQLLGKSQLLMIEKWPTDGNTQNE